MFKVSSLCKINPTDPSTFLFENISFELAPGEVLVIYGRSGIGKTTMLKCLALLEAPDGGLLTLNEKTVEEWGIPAWRSRILYVPQKTPALSGTPLDFLAQVGQFQATKERRSNNHPISIALGWDVAEVLWNSNWSELSGGECQRIMLAIALSFGPDVLLLDEPTSALDSISARLVEETLRHYRCVWVTHQRDQMISVATKMLCLD